MVSEASKSIMNGICITDIQGGLQCIPVDTWNLSLKDKHYKYKRIPVFTSHLGKLKDIGEAFREEEQHTDHREEKLSHYPAFVI